MNFGMIGFVPSLLTNQREVERFFAPIMGGSILIAIVACSLRLQARGPTLATLATEHERRLVALAASFVGWAGGLMHMQPALMNQRTTFGHVYPRSAKKPRMLAAKSALSAGLTETRSMFCRSRQVRPSSPAEYALKVASRYHEALLLESDVSVAAFSYCSIEL